MADDKMIYRIHEYPASFNFNKYYEIDEICDISGILCDYEMFPTSYGVIVICDDGKIYLYRSHSLIKEYASDRYYMPCSEIFSWWI